MAPVQGVRPGARGGVAAMSLCRNRRGALPGGVFLMAFLRAGRAFRISCLPAPAVASAPQKRCPMADVLYLLIAVAFFALMALYTRWVAQA